jgi:hypothetical protein
MNRPDAVGATFGMRLWEKHHKCQSNVILVLSYMGGEIRESVVEWLGVGKMRKPLSEMKRSFAMSLVYPSAAT